MAKKGNSSPLFFARPAWAILELINHTQTSSGLTVTAIADTNTYKTGIKVTDLEIKQINIQRDDFHGEWNYTINPQ